MMQLSEAADMYLSYRATHGVAANTYRNMSKAVRRLVESAENPPMARLSAEHIDVWSAQISYLSAATIKQQRSLVTVFLRWCRTRGYHSDGEALIESLPARKVPEKVRRRVPLSQFPALLNSADHPRDRMVIALGLFLFLRASEASALRIKDVDLDSGEIAVTVFKTQQFDRMPISAELDRELRRWLRWYTNAVGVLHDDMYLIPARPAPTFIGIGDGTVVSTRDDDVVPDRPMTRLHQVVKNSLRNIGWSEEQVQQEGMHTLRRSGARALFDTSVSLGVDGAMRRCQSMLHHKLVATTEHYLGLDTDRAQRDKNIKGAAMYPSLEGVENWSSDASPHVTSAGTSTLKAV